MKRLTYVGCVEEQKMNWNRYNRLNGEIEKMDQEVETVVVYCYKCGEIERRPNLRNESEDENVIENIVHEHIKENPGHVALVGFEISD